MKTLKLATVFAVLAAPVLAEGNAENGGKLFDRQCVSCHVVADADGNVLAGRNAHTGPNLYGVVGRTAGTLEGFNYGDSIIAAGEAGMVYDEASLATYMQDPTKWLRDVAGIAGGRSKMSFKVRKEDEAADIAAFLATFSAQ